MSNLNKYYRAFKNYRKETIDNNVCERDRLAISQANVENDVLNSTKYLCHIDEDWIIAIEEGLEFVEKAVAEERQFIRTNGEVVEIEKVKKISKDSVSHLARHSEMITHIPDDPDANIVPDKLYMVEKLSDYAVYENRFLYMMLCYLRDFINYRLDKIEKLRSSYIGNFKIKKEVISKKRKLVLETSIVEERQDNPFPIPDHESASMIQRIKNCQQIIMSLLNTDLMSQVSKSPMIKPPITKTNVLKMNNNFKRSLALYDYIASYRGDGYTYEEVNFDFTPFADKMADEIAESLNLPAFIAYKYGNNIEEYLENEYQKEERALRDQEALKLQERIKRLKKRALESNKTLEEYMLLLETRNKMLEKDSEELAVLRHEIDKLNDKISELELEREELERKITRLEEIIEEKIKEIAMLNQKYIDDIAALKNEHKIEIANLTRQHEDQILDLKEDHAQERAQLIDSYESQINDLTDELSSFKEKHKEIVEDYDHHVLVLNEKIKGLNNKQKDLVNEYEVKLQELENSYIEQMNEQKALHDAQIYEMTAENILINSQLDANRVLRGVLKPNEEMTTKERFNNLEDEYHAFKKFFKSQWKLTKKQIRKNILGNRPLQQENKQSAFVDPEVDELVRKQLLEKALIAAGQGALIKTIISNTGSNETIEKEELQNIKSNDIIDDNSKSEDETSSLSQEMNYESLEKSDIDDAENPDVSVMKLNKSSTQQQEELNDDSLELKIANGLPIMKLKKAKKPTQEELIEISSEDSLENNIEHALPVMRFKKTKKVTRVVGGLSDEQEVVKFSIKKRGGNSEMKEEKLVKFSLSKKKPEIIEEEVEDDDSNENQ